MTTTADPGFRMEPPGIRVGPAAQLAWRVAQVQGRQAQYAEAGEGPTVLFLHGWGLDHRAYRRALRRLADSGVRVLAPALPGFGGTASLPDDRTDIRGYADWAADFLDAVAVCGPVMAMGHSFGGGVAIALAGAHPERVGSLVLINSVGASAWTGTGSTARSLAQRPLWDWGIHLPADLWPLGQVRRVLPVLLTEGLGNLVRDPRAFWKVADVARRADLIPVLEELKRRGLPVVILWGKRDRIITRPAFEELRATLSEAQVVTVEGSHSWLIADPDTFGEVITNVAHIAELARAMGGTTAGGQVASLVTTAQRQSERNAGHRKGLG